MDYSTDRGKVYLLIGDTSAVVEQQIFQDDQIDALLSMNGSNVWLTAADACRAIAADAARCAIAYTLLGGDASVNRQQVPDKYLALAKTYTERSDKAPGFDIREIGNLITLDSGLDENEYDDTNSEQDYYTLLDYRSGRGA